MRIPETTAALKDGTPVTLRSPAAADAALVLDYTRELFHASADCLNGFADRFDAMPVIEEEAVIRQFEEAPRDFMLVAFAGGLVAGMLTVRGAPAFRRRHCGTIGMGVRPAYRRRGLGSLLLAACEREAPRAGVWNLQLEVRAFNRGAIELYEKARFRRVGVLEQAALVGDGYADEYVYQKVLATDAPGPR